MHNNKTFNKKIFAIYIAISFFFLGIFITFLYIILENKIVYITSLINTTAINENNITNIDTIYDYETKMLTNYPKWGEKYASINFPSLNLTMPVYYGDSLKILKYGVGTYAGGLFPGEGGSIILPSHNALDGFGRLLELKSGDKIVINANYGTFNYIVDSYKIVHETELEAFPVQNEKEMLVLYTCYPVNKSVVGRKTLRYVVYANRVGENYEG